MKVFDQLNAKQKNKAVAKALGILVKSLVDGFVNIEFKNSFNNTMFETIMVSHRNTEDKRVIYRAIMENESLSNELINLATNVAEGSLYSEAGDHIIGDVA